MQKFDDCCTYSCKDNNGCPVRTLRVRARWDQTHRWGVDGPGRVELTDAINLYADILQQSSPAQMQSACDLRHEILTGKRRDPRITRETQA